MSNIINMTVISTMGYNKEVVPDKDGYYLVTLGAFNVANVQGMVYSSAGVREFIEDTNNLLNRRLVGGRLRSETEHPRRTPGMSDAEFVMRMIRIPLTGACGQIRELIIIETDKSEGIPGLGNIMLIKGRLRPSGINGAALKDSLDNPNEDTCFSIRSFAKNVRRGLTIYKYIKQIITWDWVNDPGIQYASKLGSPSVESADLFVGEVDGLIEAINSGKLDGVGMESDEIVECIKELGIDATGSDIVGLW